MASILFWNCRGARKKQASLYLKEMVKDYKVFFVGLLETKVSNFSKSEIENLIGKDWNFFQVPAIGLSGGIIVLWKYKLASFTCLSSSNQVIIGDLEIMEKGRWRVATVYRGKDTIHRRLIWEKLKEFRSNNIPLLLRGDFNCVLAKEEKKGGRPFQFSQGPREMSSFLARSGLHEVSFIGPKFTWCNNKDDNARILERLDRCNANSVALKNNQMVLRHLSRVASDHNPILLNFLEENFVSDKIIRFEEV
ncbi:uncharacterized protein LOC110098201 [Dendrobium catenatum]|uniref:uncharacterized protein LOC110098201 n=1 Tax=Dendrobium catenatum TaxID=906689 RepID=UPI0009F340D5|nr:uncharacterized protein LOC110098201 [Dendrobium catenatum]